MACLSTLWFIVLLHKHGTKNSSGPLIILPTHYSVAGDGPLIMLYNHCKDGKENICTVGVPIKKVASDGS